ncbi:unnamed protein product [Ilex paraguariensis]|uniref:Uncharacterized protein n=1 Tax=Ilex paraguariensis TaxID=185542 RepID=A0ABC8UXX6_9AQUA
MRWNNNLIALFADKPLLMLQSIKRAFRIDPKNVELHSCIVRFAVKLVTLKKQTEPATESPVLTVIEQEMEPILRGRSADQINKEFLAENSNSLPALFEAARMMYLLDESKQEEAVKLTTSLEPHITDVDLQDLLSHRIAQNFNGRSTVAPLRLITDRPNDQ